MTDLQKSIKHKLQLLHVKSHDPSPEYTENIDVIIQKQIFH